MLTLRQEAVLEALAGAVELERQPTWASKTLRHLSDKGWIEFGYRCTTECWFRSHPIGPRELVEEKDEERQFLYRITKSGRAALAAG